MGKAFGFGFSYGMKNKWFALNKADGTISRVAETLEDETVNVLKGIQESGECDKKLAKILKKKKFVKQKTTKLYVAKKGEEFALEVVEKIADLTGEMLKTGAWKDAKFKKFNLKSLGKELSVGGQHPLLRCRSDFRSILLELGFTEMKTNNYVESSFWNFDSLFQPQQHPARDAHDTFFLKEPAQCKILDKEYWEKVKNMHEKGDESSIGWRYNWSYEEAKKNIFRTHTTAVSARMLYKIAKEGFKPVKLFSIDRVFRNETLDATHLAEFHQIEGVVCGYNLGLQHLMGIIREFFRKIGITKIKFKPAYNPYTEPSMEIFCYHPQLKKMIEIGNSGIFRPEMLKPMGLPDNCSVIAWGLSLERPTMINYGIDNIRKLFGYDIDVKDLRTSSICCFTN